MLNKQQFTEIIKNKLLLRPKELSLLKDKNIVELIDKCEGIFEEYLRQKTRFIFPLIISKICSEIVVSDIYINKIDVKDLDWDLIKEKILEEAKAIRFDNERLNVFIPDLLNDMASNMDSSIATLKDTIIRWPNHILHK